MGELAADTAVTRTGEGTYVAMLNPEWEIWGPQGGYVAACGLRAIGAASTHQRPVAFSCHYLSVAAWGEVELRVDARKEGRGASAYRVEMTQGDRRILDAMAWTDNQDEGLEYDEAVMPDVPLPDDLKLIQELLPEGVWPPFPFWRNLDYKLANGPDWPARVPGVAVWQSWLRFVPSTGDDDPWVDAARSVVLIDVSSWPAVRGRSNDDVPYVAPTLDLNVAFHRAALGEDWLLCDSAAPVSTGGLFGWNARVWSQSGALHASGGGQCRYRKL
ncbi:MAG TPA: thioesterase family protein [Mycobacteriales bacterium]|nr:thioesterase family protein [Mycobacteriales bacterium]